MQSRAPAEFGHASSRAVATAAVAALLLASVIGNSASAQTRADDNASASINLGARSGVAANAPVRPTPPQDSASNALEFSLRSGFATDYVYRGTTLSNHRPAVGAALEAAFGSLYAGANITSVKLPTQPTAEVTVSGGIRPKIWDINFDFGWTYLFYPGETPPSGLPGGTDYWEAAARADTRLGEALRIGASFAYSPNISNTGAWSRYAAVGLGTDLPPDKLPQNITASLTAVAGYFWFGNQSAALGGFPLPAYLTWNAGVTLTREKFNLDLRYYDTNLSKESCFVFTGDPHATTGGNIDPVKNPGGLTSRWCSATFVAKFWFALN